jgi:hypothetical protein
VRGPISYDAAELIDAVTPQTRPIHPSAWWRRRRRRREHPTRGCPKGEKKTELQRLKYRTGMPHPEQRCPETRKRRRMSRRATRLEWWDSHQARSRQGPAQSQ